MHLTDVQKDLFWMNYKKLKNGKLSKNGLSKYAIREIKLIYQVNNDINENRLDQDFSFNEADVLREFKRIFRVIDTHPKAEHAFKSIFRDVKQSSNEQLLIKLIRLEAAIGLEIDLKYQPLIERAFDEVYSEVIEKTYQDCYKKFN